MKNQEIKRTTNNEFRIGMGWIQTSYISTDPRCLKRFEFGEEVWILSDGTLQEYRDLCKYFMEMINDIEDIIL